MKTVIIALAITLGLVGGLVLIGNLSSGEDPNNPTATQPVPEVTEADHVRGNLEAEVTFIEYLDFQCPFCARYHPLVEAIVAEYSDRVRFVTRSFPISSAHPNAYAAHRAAEAAGAQGKFFEMHDMLFERQAGWSEAQTPKDIIDQFAIELGLDMDKYNTVYEDPATLSFINAQRDAGNDAGVGSTPTFVLNGTVLEQAPSSLADFQEMFEEALAKAQATPIE